MAEVANRRMIQNMTDSGTRIALAISLLAHAGLLNAVLKGLSMHSDRVPDEANPIRVRLLSPPLALVPVQPTTA
jgi:hypothetical protein